MISSARAKQSLEYEFGLRTFTPESTYYLGLSTTDPATGITEPASDTGYARVEILNNGNSWGEVATGEFYLKNKIAFIFPLLSKAANDVSFWFLATSETGKTTPPYYGALSTPRPMPADSQIIVGEGEMKIYRENIKS